ncbi:MAG: hypothetical protein WBW71_07810 [Bacteroidota bacterium]
MVSHVKFFVTLAVCFFLVKTAGAQSTDSSAQEWNFHFQQTIVVQYHPDFTAKYSGTNSLDTSEGAKTSLTSGDWSWNSLRLSRLFACRLRWFRRKRTNPSWT